MNDNIVARKIIHVPSKYEKSVKGFYRRNIGTYSQRSVKFVGKVVKFIFKRFTPFNLDIILRGRGERKAKALAKGLYQGAFRQDLPLSEASKVAVYVSIIRR